MTYNIPRDGGNNIIVPDYTVNSDTSLDLLGRGTINYGAIMASNLIQLLQHFSSATEPTNPSLGQIWFRNSTKSLLVCKNAGGASFQDRWDELVTASQNGLTPLEEWSIENLRYIVQLQNINPNTAIHNQVALAVLSMVAQGLDNSWDHKNLAYLLANQGITYDSTKFDQINAAIQALISKMNVDSWAHKSLQTLVVNEGMTFNNTNYNQVPNSVGLIAIRANNQSWVTKNAERLLTLNNLSRNDANNDQLAAAVAQQANVQISQSWAHRNLTYLLGNNGQAPVAFNNNSNDQIVLSIARLIGANIAVEARDRDLADQALSGAIAAETAARNSFDTHINNEVINTNNQLAALGGVVSGKVTAGTGFAGLGGEQWYQAQNGYLRLPNGFLIQWGNGVSANNGTHGQLFNTAFPNICVHVGTYEANADNGWDSPNGPAPTFHAASKVDNFGFSHTCVRLPNGGQSRWEDGASYRWFAFGW